MAKKILVVDDELQIVKMISARLTALGYEVSTALDGNDALKKAKEIPPDLIILDIVMPGLDGTDISQILKEDKTTANIPIIFVTGLLDKKEAGNIHYSIAGKYFLAKPFDSNELINTVRKVLKEG
ncbi:MAG: response regulator [Candidatus Aminicenantes bacterium]|nr:response regulator [Candidatus Aminicenantes bacterium]